MQSAFNQQPKLRLSMIALACQLACLSLSANAQTAQEVAATTPRAEVVITGKKIGMGLMVTEDAPKARSTITAEELEKQRPTGNAYEALEMLPSVNSYNYDATGLFGGGLSLRGFNSDQIGATINGVPVNDSGNFAVYPQEYVDQENTCSQFVTQGSTDVDSPQVGASGGNFGIVTCAPEKIQRVRLMQTIGQLAAHKTFVRYDTGLMSDKRSKAFISYSDAGADKWKGEGKAHREHIDAGFTYEWDRFNYIAATLLWNKAMNNNINNLTLSEINSKGYYYDTSPVFVGHLAPVKGTAQKEATQTPPFYGLSNNPFKNGIFSATAKFRLGENTDVKVVPYYWYGFGNGGIQQRAQSEAAFLNRTTNKNTATVDLNGDGDTLDTVLVANASVTRTQRPGVTASVTHTFGNNEVLAGFWYEKATHQQTGSMVPVAQDGSYDVWLQQNKILRPDGTPFESRDNRTISTAWQAFVQDTVSMLDSRFLVNVGLRTPHIKRDVTNFASEGNQNPTYQIVRDYNTVLPQFGARYKITNDDQVFMSVAKNMKAPPNFVFTNIGTNVKIVNGVVTLNSDVNPETSWNTDVGYRHQDSRYIATVTAFGVDFKNRQVSYFDPVANASYYTNVGDVKSKGLEIEVNNMPINGWSLYGSLGYLKTEIKNDIRVAPATATLTGLLPTAGKELPGSPRLKAGLALEYSQNAFWARVKAKATSEQQGTFANEELPAPGYTTFGLDAGYTFANYGILKRPKLTFNASNITNKQYRNPGSGIPNNSAIPGAVTTTSTLRYYLGAPRFMSLTLSVDI
jgi:iron complex outermembrane receptor protein